MCVKDTQSWLDAGRCGYMYEAYTTEISLPTFWDTKWHLGNGWEAGSMCGRVGGGGGGSANMSDIVALRFCHTR